MPARLLIGPLLRRVVDTRATIWVETSAPAVVTVRTADGATGTRAHLLRVRPPLRARGGGGADPGQRVTRTRCCSTTRWSGRRPGSGFPPSVIRTRAADDRDQPVSLIFGSCRETTQHATARKLPPDALDAYARR